MVKKKKIIKKVVKKSVKTKPVKKTVKHGFARLTKARRIELSKMGNLQRAKNKRKALREARKAAKV